MERLEVTMQPKQIGLFLIIIFGCVLGNHAIPTVKYNYFKSIFFKSIFCLTKLIKPIADGIFIRQTGQCAGCHMQLATHGKSEK